MSRTNSSEPKRDLTPAEQRESFLVRRLAAFAERSRDPGDAATWAVVLGALMCALLIICFAVSGRTDAVLLIPVVASLLWGVVVQFWGRVNIAAILWGSSTTDSQHSPHLQFIFLPTLILTTVSFVCVVVDAFTGWGFRWFGLALIATGIWFLMICLRAWTPHPS